MNESLILSFPIPGKRRAPRWELAYFCVPSIGEELLSGTCPLNVRFFADFVYLCWAGRMSESCFTSKRAMWSRKAHPQPK